LDSDVHILKNKACSCCCVLECITSLITSEALLIRLVLYVGYIKWKGGIYYRYLSYTVGWTCTNMKTKIRIENRMHTNMTCNSTVRIIELYVIVLSISQVCTA
jgi:hypothetical protein